MYIWVICKLYIIFNLDKNLKKYIYIGFAYTCHFALSIIIMTITATTFIINIFMISNIIAFITTDVNSSVIIFVMIIIFCTFI